MNGSSSFRARRGFTLVELLVVIGIIALLMSILLPTLGRVRQQANAIKCASNMRSLLQSCMLYSSDNKGYIIPAGTNNDGWWPNILIDFGYLKARSATEAEVAAGLGPMAEGVLYCPDGIVETLPPDLTGSATVPATREDRQGAMGTRHKANKSKSTIDVWYGINADTDGNYPLTGTPCRRLQGAQDLLMKQTVVRQPSEMVMLFDGLIYHHLSVNFNRVNSRHMNFTQTNLGFFDGHIETWKTSMLPGGSGNANLRKSDFDIANLNTKFVGTPKWKIEQR